MKRVFNVVVASILAAGLGVGVPHPATAVAEMKPAVPSDSIVNPDGMVVKKGAPLKDVAVTSTNKVRKGNPNLGGMSTLASCDGIGPSACYLYNVGSQTGFSKNGVQANVLIGGHSGALNTSTDYHTLGEIAVQSSDSQQIVEVGWTVDPAVNAGSSNPRPFVFRWVNGVAGCYNGCGYVPVASPAVTPGVTDLTVGAYLTLGIWHDDSQAVWWIRWGSSWIGYFPDSLWTLAVPSVSFTRTTSMKLFGEIASTESKPCSDMGRGVPPTNASTARFGSTSFYNSNLTLDSAAVNLSLWTLGNAGSPYAGVLGAGSPPSTTNLRTFYYGGPMWNAAGTVVGSTGSC